MKDKSVAKPCDCYKSKDPKKYGRKAIFFAVIALHVAVFTMVYLNKDIDTIDYVSTWLFGCLLASIELSSKYKDDPASVLSSSPGVLYLGINGLICVLGLYLMYTFGLGVEVDDSLPLLAQRTMDVLQASLSSFFVMRSSFLKLGHNSQIDLGLNAVLKKLLEIVDREVDRVRAVKRSRDITVLFEDVCHTNTKHVFSLCLNVMQNVSIEEAAEIQRKLDELESVIGTSDKSIMDLNMMQLAIGLELYNIVGISVLTAAVQDLKLDKKSSNGGSSCSTEKDKVQGSSTSHSSVEDPEQIVKNLRVKFRKLSESGKSDEESDT
ncbi:hypothetical protein ABRZ80_05245 [Vibrio vulnificus]|uniref:hypothetical protein n=1 Tax=Vibrio TaxID=662 RepID=UPI00041815A6|nr:MULTISPECIES: hypothetical protein [Vibrio]EGQ7762832.1 hypothetical protein [Vibrio alginolyticus]ELF6831605.1 hypothetical protein [Vibrio cholerae]MDF4486272.1 hypothetical protein [Vibrio parahaemolyticus]MDG3380833.1 hypothetical protein [Vibrio parahaemolyticus]NWK16860.1 hypothetical protein [Vibrio parahaemolyticus]